MRSFKPLLVFTCVLLAHATLASAQVAIDLDNDALVSRVKKEIDALTPVGDKARAEREALEELDASLKEAKEAAYAPLPDEPDEISGLEALDEQSLRDQVELQERYLTAYRKRKEQRDRIPSLTDARRKMIKQTIDALRLTQQRAGDLRPLLTELARRKSAGRISQDKVDLGDNGVDFWRESVTRQQSDCAAWIETYSAEKQLLKSQPVPDGDAPTSQSETLWNLDTDRRLQRALDVTTIILQAARHEATERKELEQTDDAVLPALIARVHDDWLRETAEYQIVLARGEVKRVALSDMETNRRELASPSKESISQGKGHAELKTARRDAAFSDKLVEYLDARLKLMLLANDVAKELLKELAAVPPAFERVRRLTIKLKATLQVADRRRRDGHLAALEVPEGVSISSLTAAMGTMANLEAARRRQVDQLEHRQDKKAIETAKEESGKEKQNNERLHNILREELSYAAVLEEMGALSETALVTLVQPNGTINASINKRNGAMHDARRELDRVEQDLRAVRETIRFVETPYVRMGFRIASNRLDEIKTELDRLEAGQLPEDRSSNPLLRAAAVDSVGAIGGDGDGSSQGDQTLLEHASSAKEALEVRQDFATAHWQYFANLDEKIKRYTAALDAADKAFTLTDQAWSALVNEEKRKYACARELQLRLSQGRIERTKVPFDLSKALTREAVAQVQSDRDRRARAFAKLRKSHQDERDKLKAVAQFGEWAKIRAEFADKKATLITQPVQRIGAAAMSFDDLAKVDQKQLEYDAKNLREEDDVRWESLLASVSRVKKRELFDESLDTFYLTIARIDRQLSDYAKASESYRDLIELCNAERTRIVDAPERLKEGLQLRILSYQRARHLAAVAAAPSARLTIEDAFKKTFGSPLPIVEQTHDWDKDFWANHLFAAETRLWGHRTWTQDVRKLLSRLGLDFEIAQYDEHQAKIENKIRGLTGLRENHRNSIAVIRSDYSKEIYGASLRTLVSLLLIPLLAWILVRIVNHFAGRIEERAMDGLARDRISYHERMKTISAVTRKTVSVVVWIIAGLYLLHELGTPVSTLLASAGVLGLAFAFGAQSLIRDFFHGFFILLENQYTIGDWIMVGGIGGTVERLTLRVTVLRDMEGTLHFIPNGAIASVSNMTHGWSQVKMEIGVGYGEDIERVNEVILDAATSVCESSEWKDKVLAAPVVPGLQSFGDSSLNLRLVVKTQPGVQWGLARALRKRIKERFDEEGIEIPFPQRVIHHIHDSDSKTSQGKATQDDR